MYPVYVNGEEIGIRDGNVIHVNAKICESTEAESKARGIDYARALRVRTCSSGDYQDFCECGGKCKVPVSGNQYSNVILQTSDGRQFPADSRSSQNLVDVSDLKTSCSLLPDNPTRISNEGSVRKVAMSEDAEQQQEQTRSFGLS